MNKKKKTLTAASKKAKPAARKTSKASPKAAKAPSRKAAKASSKAVKAPSRKGAKNPSPRKPRNARESRILDIRARLVDQKDKLLSEAGTALGLLPGQILFPDLGDQASAEIDRNFMLRLRGREQKLLKKIEQVLEKIDFGNYGICEICGCEIEIQRLEARPVTGMCIECKTEQEDEEKLRE